MVWAIAPSEVIFGCGFNVFVAINTLIFQNLNLTTYNHSFVMFSDGAKGSCWYLSKM